MNLALVLGGTLLAFFLSEGVLRFLNPPQFATHHHPCIYIGDSEIGYAFEPGASDWSRRTGEMHNLARINSLGFHDIEHDYDSDKAGVRIAVLGDSIAAALEVDVSESWTQIFQSELRGGGIPGAHVFNMGLNGTGTDVHFKLLQRHLSLLEPDIVILAFFWNDVKDVGRPLYYKECYRDYILCYMNEEQKAEMISSLDKRMPGNLKRWLFEKSFVFRAMTSALGRNVLLHQNYLRPPDLDVTSGKVPKGKRKKIRIRLKLRRSLNQFIHLSNQHDFKFIVMPIPGKKNINSSIDALREGVSDETLDRLDIIDVSPAIEELMKEGNTSYTDLFWATDAHYNVNGNRILGRAAAQTLIDQAVTPG